MHLKNQHKINNSNLPSKNNKRRGIFRFKQFVVRHDKCAMKVGTDSVLLGAWCQANKPKTILDIGSGSGLLSLMMAQRFRNTSITGVEIDKNAYLQSVENAQKSTWSKQISFVNSSIQSFVKQSNVSYDLIISNPPFFRSGLASATKERTIARSTASLQFIDLLKSVDNLLTPTGSFSLILPYTTGLFFLDLAEQSFNLQCHDMCYVCPRKQQLANRLLMSFRKKNDVSNNSNNVYLQMSTLNIREAHGNSYTKQYIELTRDFYLNF